MRISRRSLVAGAALLPLARPGLSRAADRPVLGQGVQSGDVTAEGAVVWTRADRPARARVDVATSDRFAEVLATTWVDLLPESDFTGKVLLDGLPAGQDLFYRFTPQSLTEPSVLGEPAVGRFRTAPADRRDVTFVWSGDTAGQGWGIDLDRGGMRTYAAMLRHRPDFFIHSGDTVYADNPILPEQAMPGGEVWRNIAWAERQKAAESLDEFRTCWRYNFLDGNLRAFNAEVPTLAQWDDHDVMDNWWPDQPLDQKIHRSRGYREPFVSPLVARAARAFHEYMPVASIPQEPGRVYRKVGYGPQCDVFLLDMRSYRGPNSDNRQESMGPEAAVLGPAQLAWLKRSLATSTATWKIIAADQPLGLIVFDDFVARKGSEAIGQGDGPPLGRELEIADLLAFLRRNRIRNTVWVTADVHYTAAHRYSPDRARFQDFDPFWEFVSGPIHAGTFGPNALDPTFGPEVVFMKAPPPGQFNLPPSAGYQFFGHGRIEGTTGQLTITLRDVGDNALWSVTLDPEQ